MGRREARASSPRPPDGDASRVEGTSARRVASVSQMRHRGRARSGPDAPRGTRGTRGGGRDERRGRSETLVRVGKPVRSAARCASPRGERGRDWSVPGRASMLRSSSQARACVRPRRINRLADDRPTACRALIRDLTRQDRVRPAIVSANQISPRNFLAQDASLSSVWPDAWRRAGHCDVARSHPTREFTSRPAGHVTRHREANPGRIQRGETTREVASSARVRGVFG